MRDNYSERTSKQICIGDTVEIVNNKKYNNNLHKRLHMENKGRLGCEIEIIDVAPISQHGYSMVDFEKSEQAT